MSYIYSHFICKSHEHCNNEAKHWKIHIIHSEITLFSRSEPAFYRLKQLHVNSEALCSNKFIFIMLLKLLKTLLKRRQWHVQIFGSYKSLDCFRKSMPKTAIGNIQSCFILLLLKCYRKYDQQSMPKYLSQKYFINPILEIREMLEETITLKEMNNKVIV